MLNGITRLKTPASLVKMDDEGNVQDITARRVYQQMHGYLPIPYTSHRALFDRTASRKQSDFVVEFGSPASFLEPDGSFSVRIDLLSAEPASDALLKSLVTTGSKLFAGELGEDIVASSAMVCGVGIVCCDPQRVTADRLTVRNLLDEFVTEVEALLRTPKTASVNRRSSHFGLICWLTYSFKQLLPDRIYNSLDALTTALESCGRRVPADKEKNRCRDLFFELETKLKDLQ